MSNFKKSTLKRTSTERHLKSKNEMQKKPSVNKVEDVKNKGDKESEVLQPHSKAHVSGGSSHDLSSPGLCSALQLANEIQVASKGTSKVEELKLFQQKQLDVAIKQKVLKKANIPFTKHIFKDLIDLHLSDEEFSAAKTHTKNVNLYTNKDPVFRLDDFFKPDYSTEVSVNVPEQKFEIEKIDYYSGLELYERIESLKKLG